MLLLPFLKEILLMRSLRCLLPFQFYNYLNDFHKIWYGHYVSGGHLRPYLTPWSTVTLMKLTFAQLLFRSSLPCSEEPITGPYPQQMIQSIPHLISSNLILILSSHLCLGLRGVNASMIHNAYSKY
jgi:hypothetical protein